MLTVQTFNEGVLLYAIYMIWDNLSICSDKCKKVYVFMYEVIFDRNGAKAYIKIYEFSLREKSAKRGLMESFSHSSTARIR